MSVILNYINILETAQTVVPTDVNIGYPKGRLYDRDIGKEFRGLTFPANWYLVVTQYVTNIIQVDRLIIPAGHNFNGLSLKLQYSTTGAWAGEQVDALSWAQTDALIINKSFTAASKQYWRLNVIAPTSVPTMTEFYLTKDYTWEIPPNFGLREGYKRNMIRGETRSGRTRVVLLGEPRRSRQYELRYFSVTQKTDFENWEIANQGAKFFYLTDHNGTLIFMEMLNDMTFIPNSALWWSCDFDFLEVL